MPQVSAGSKYGIYVGCCEGLLISGNYMGGQSINSILLGASNILSGVRITDNFFDGASYNGYIINISTGVDGQIVSGVNISGNWFNGELYSFTAIGSVNPLGTNPTITDFTITNNCISNFVGSAIVLRLAIEGVIGNNIISAYNVKNLTAGGDPLYGAALYLAACTSINVDGNIMGGAINSGLPSSYSYTGLVKSTCTNVIQRNTVWNGAGLAGNQLGRIDKETVAVTANYTMTGMEDLVIVNNSGATAIQITAPSLIPTGFTFILKDGSGTAAAHALQIVGVVDGATNPTYSTNYVAKTFTWNGTQWNVTGN